MKKLMKGDRVKFIAQLNESAKATGYYPEIGTIGTVLATYENMIEVQWPDGSTKGDGIWECYATDVEIVPFTVAQTLRMSDDEDIQKFLYMIYLCGVEDGKNNISDDEFGYFNNLVNRPFKEVIDKIDEIYYED